MAAGTTSGLVIVGAIGLMALGGPVGMIAGSAALSGGISGIGNAVEQAHDDSKDEFKLGSFVGNIAVNASVGALTAGAGTALAGAKSVATLGKVAQVAV